MNCPVCGKELPQGAVVCPACQSPAGQKVYQQSYAQYQQASYPTGYQQPYTYGGQPSGEDNSFLTVLAELPRSFLHCFTNPGEVLRGMVERRDYYSGAVVAVVVLMLSFIGGMVVMRGFVSDLFYAISVWSGVLLAGSDASLNQGISYIAGRVAPSVGGIAALFQLISMLVPTAVFMVYICVRCKITFSWELLLGFLGVTSLPTVAVALLAMASALLSPWIALILMVLGAAISYMQACSMLSLITGRSEQQLMAGKLVCTCLSIALTLALCGLTGGALAADVVQSIVVLFSSAASLI